MTITEKLTAIRTVLAEKPEIAAWYATEHRVTADDFTADNVAAYGLTGLGEIADSILEDARAEG